MEAHFVYLVKVRRVKFDAGLYEWKALRDASRFSCTSIFMPQKCLPTHHPTPTFRSLRWPPESLPPACVLPHSQVCMNRALHRTGKRRPTPRGMS